MRNMLHIGGVLLGWGLWATAAEANTVDITMVPTEDGRLEVRLRPQEAFDGIVSNVVFTIRWNASSDVHLGEIEQVAPSLQHVPLMKSDVEIDADGSRYQIFVSVGSTALNWTDAAWAAGQEYAIGRIAVEGGPTTFGLVNDDWTDLHNGSFYVSLGGLDQTGEIYEGLSTGVEAGRPAGDDLQVMPNPTDRESVISFTPKEAERLDLQLVDAVGSVVWQRSLGVVSSPWRGTLDMAPFAAGVYLLRLHGTDTEIVRRVIRK
ncbi:MAG TPA: T9SS type A sorting domain-containing protein [Flavobacteriales bacterium]